MTLHIKLLHQTSCMLQHKNHLVEKIKIAKFAGWKCMTSITRLFNHRALRLTLHGIWMVKNIKSNGKIETRNQNVWILFTLTKTWKWRRLVMFVRVSSGFSLSLLINLKIFKGHSDIQIILGAGEAWWKR